MCREASAPEVSAEGSGAPGAEFCDLRLDSREVLSKEGWNIFSGWLLESSQTSRVSNQGRDSWIQAMVSSLHNKEQVRISGLHFSHKHAADMRSFLGLLRAQGLGGATSNILAPVVDEPMDISI